MQEVAHFFWPVESTRASRPRLKVPQPVHRQIGEI